jgi:NAD/NADP transhydrogenase alpha subunit
MYINVAVLTETRAHERHPALVPSVAQKLIKLGARLHMQPGAGVAIHLDDAAFGNVTFIADRTALVKDADVVLAVQPPALEVVNAMKEGAILVSFIYAHNEPALLKRLLEKKITCFAMERVPRITRAQSMDALSSQSALAGYYAVQLGSTHLARVVPKITSAAGSIGPAHVLVMGLGVAGLEAIATAHRLGAVVEGYDVRPETQEQALSLGATFVNTGIDARGKGGYARELSAEEKIKVADVLTKHIQSALPGIAQAHQPRTVGRHESRLGDRRSVGGRRRQLRRHAAWRDYTDRQRDDRRAAERAFDARRGRERAVCEESVQPARFNHERQRHRDRLERRSSRQNGAHPRGREQGRGERRGGKTCCSCEKAASESRTCYARVSSVIRHRHRH